MLTIKHLAVPFYITTTSSFLLKKTTCSSTWPIEPFKTFTFKWPCLSIDLDFQMTLSFNWPWLSDDLVFQLTLSFNWPWLSDDLDFQMTLTFRWPWLSDDLDSLNSTQTIQNPIARVTFFHLWSVLLPCPLLVDLVLTVICLFFYRLARQRESWRHSLLNHL